MNKPQNITSERIETLEIKLEQAQFTINQLDLVLVLEREKLAEVQADNAALIHTIKAIHRHIHPHSKDRPIYLEIIDNICDSVIYDNPHPGASLLAELEQLREAYESCEAVKAFMTMPRSYYDEEWAGEKEDRYGWAKVRYEKAKQALAQAKEVAP